MSGSTQLFSQSAWLKENFEKEMLLCLFNFILGGSMLAFCPRGTRKSTMNYSHFRTIKRQLMYWFPDHCKEKYIADEQMKPGRSIFLCNRHTLPFKIRHPTKVSRRFVRMKESEVFAHFMLSESLCWLCSEEHLI
jgi:hypothetical protein